MVCSGLLRKRQFGAVGKSPIPCPIFKQFNVPKAAQVLAEVLREKILQGELKEGADLPAEREPAQ
jgi:hypothetical protein